MVEYNSKNSNKNKNEKIKKKNIQKKEGKPKKKRKVWKIILIIFLVLVVLGIMAAGAAIGIFFGMFGNDLKLSASDLVVGATNSTVVDANGGFLGTIAGDEKRQYVKLDAMPTYLPKAYVAIEDERFYDHHGVDIKRTASAIISYITSGGHASFGGSTITQQLVKNLTSYNDDTWQRKVMEWGRAYNLEKMLSKDQILELYLNILFVGGSDLHGVEMGAEYYFNKHVGDLDLAESAFLAGINSSPNSYNPFNSDSDGAIAARIKSRTNTVIDKMLQLGYIDQDAHDKAVEEVNTGLTFKQGTIVTANLSYNTEAAINQVVSDYQALKGCSADFAKLYIYGSGLTIHTTQVTSIQKTMETELKKTKYMYPNPIKKGEVSQAAMVIIDPTTGYVVGEVGGTGDKTTVFGFNRGTQAERQPGSSIKPLAVYGPALQEGLITAGSVYDDVPTKFGNYQPKNYYGGYKGLSTIREALSISQNIIPVKILSELGVDKSINYLKEEGITSLTDKDAGLALALGGLTTGVSPLEMAAAYNMINNDGVYISPTFYTTVTDSNGNVVLQSQQTKTRVMSVQNAYILKNLLTAPVVGINGQTKVQGTYITAYLCNDNLPSGMDVAAKTGTTSSDKDRWLCGFTPYYTTAIWFGYDTPAEIPSAITGGINPGAYIFRDVMGTIHKDLPAKKFTVPSGIVKVPICIDSGELPGPNCNDTIQGNEVYTEVFVNGTQPTKTCDVHVQATVVKQGDKYLLAPPDYPGAVPITFITRPNSDKTTAWKSAADAKYMLPTDVLDTGPVVEPNQPENPDTGNITVPPDQNVIIPPPNTNTVPGENTTPPNTNNTTGGNNTPPPETNNNTTVENPTPPESNNNTTEENHTVPETNEPAP
ncbi:MAG: penicillin-binding protein [Oscillospiraceae bacterium]|nr:penicillin-binding protein [Oscillospiraceae bacterium]